VAAAPPKIADGLTTIQKSLRAAPPIP